VHIGVVVSRVALARPGHTTVRLCAAALARGWAVDVYEADGLGVSGGGVRGAARALRGPGDADAVVTRLQSMSTDEPRGLRGLDVLLLRANPYQDGVVTFGMFAQAEGVRVLNDPRGLVVCAHKGWLATLPDVPQPRTLVTTSASEATAFAAGLGAGVVVKPTRAGGGRGVVWAPDGRDAAAVSDAVEVARRESFDGYVVVQEYLPEADAGEKRVLWVDGRVVGGYLRMRPSGDFRHNLKVGGRPLPCELTVADHAVAEALTPHLRAAGVWFAGIDVIGGRVVEVNTLNPGGAAHTAVFSGVDVADLVLSSLLSPPIR